MNFSIASVDIPSGSTLDQIVELVKPHMENFYDIASKGIFLYGHNAMMRPDQLSSHYFLSYVADSVNKNLEKKGFSKDIKEAWIYYYVRWNEEVSEELDKRVLKLFQDSLPEHRMSKMRDWHNIGKFSDWFSGKTAPQFRKFMIALLKEHRSYYKEHFLRAGCEPEPNDLLREVFAYAEKNGKEVPFREEFSGICYRIFNYDFQKAHGQGVVHQVYSVRKNELLLQIG